MNRTSLVIHGQFNIGERGGVGRYGQQLYNHLTSQPGKAELSSYDIFFPGLKESIGEDLSSQPRSARFMRTVKHTLYRTLPPVLYEPLQRLYAGRQNYRGAFARAHTPECASTVSPALLHELTNYNIIDNIGLMSLSPKFSLLVTFLDIQDLYYPNHFRPASLDARRLLYSFFKDRADCFLAISEFTKQTMVERLGISPERIRVTHLAADDMLRIHPTENEQKQAASLGRFLLYPAKALQHKNHDFLISAFGKRQKECRRAGLKLALTGGFTKEDTNRFNRLINENNAHEIIRVFGFVSDAQLQTLIKAAEFLVFPSLFEGFGMPVLEAMTLGCPVIASNAGSLPEVGGDAAVYFDPESEDEFIALLDGILQQKGLDRNEMIRKGFVNCQRFSWQKTYNETVAVYNKLTSRQ